MQKLGENHTQVHLQVWFFPNFYSAKHATEMEQGGIEVGIAE
jgi:hypothetical protein